MSAPYLLSFLFFFYLKDECFKLNRNGKGQAKYRGKPSIGARLAMLRMKFIVISSIFPLMCSFGEKFEWKIRQS